MELASAPLVWSIRAQNWQSFLCWNWNMITFSNHQIIFCIYSPPPSQIILNLHFFEGFQIMIHPTKRNTNRWHLCAFTQEFRSLKCFLPHLQIINPFRSTRLPGWALPDCHPSQKETAVTEEPSGWLRQTVRPCVNNVLGFVARYLCYMENVKTCHYKV